MANRVLIGNHPTHGQGIYVSKSGEDVTGSTVSDLSFTSHITDSTSGITSLNGEMLNIYQRGYTDITIAAGDMWNTATVTYARSAFNDGSNDRCPFILAQMGKASGTSPSTHWMPCMLRQKNSTDDRRAAQGFRYKVRPYKTADNGEIEFVAFRGSAWDGSSEGDSSAITYRIYYTIFNTILS